MTEIAHIPGWQTALLEKHQLGRAYLETALKWFTPLTRALLKHQCGAKRPVLIALNGCQGSGKTTVSDFLCHSLREEFGLHAVALSLDDFYLTNKERQMLAVSVHPLLATRGVPGTHDMTLLRQTLNQLLDPERRKPVTIPGFDKSTDDRLPASDWAQITGPVGLVLLEGWCLGARPESADILSQPINDLERDEDAAGRWREYSNEVLRAEFQSLYALVDQWIMLCAPSFNSVFEWRREQEHKLGNTLSSNQTKRLMDDNALHRFIQHFERLTRRCLDDLPPRVNHLFRLNEQRQVTDYKYRRHVEGPA